MKIIKNSEELAKLVDKDKDLFLDEDVRIEFSPKKKELRDVRCRNLFMMNDLERFNFNGRDFYGWDFTGRDFNGWNFYGWNFTGRDFNGWNFYGGDFTGRDFNGWNFTGKNVSYYVFFNCYGSIKCESIKARSTLFNPPVSLINKIEIKKVENKK